MNDEGTDRTAHVDAGLVHLIDRANERAAAGEIDELRRTLVNVQAVARADLPAGDLRERLLFGCSRVEYHADADYEVAVEYLRAMNRLLE